jgi:hypothetical protein
VSDGSTRKAALRAYVLLEDTDDKLLGSQNSRLSLLDMVLRPPKLQDPRIGKTPVHLLVPCEGTQP